MDEQYNHHCILSFMGFNWWIVESKTRSQALTVARRVDPNTVIVGDVDISRVDWENYAKAAVAWDIENEKNCTSQA